MKLILPVMQPGEPGEQPEIFPQRSPQIFPGVPGPEINPAAPDNPEFAPEPSPDATPPDPELPPQRPVRPMGG